MTINGSNNQLTTRTSSGGLPSARGTVNVRADGP
jgi:hypothetical protein